MSTVSKHSYENTYKVDAGLSQFFSKIYAFLGMGISLSALVSYLLLVPYSSLLLNLITNHAWFLIGATVLEFVLVISISGSARKNTPFAMPLFLIYSVLNGFTLSAILLQYTKTTVFQAFISTAAIFLVMSAIGAMTKRNLSGLATFSLVALIGLIIASVINIFIGSGVMSFVISVVSVVLFAGLTAFDNNIIKSIYYSQNGEVNDGWAVSMALTLYLDFINIFISLLRIFGKE